MIRIFYTAFLSSLFLLPLAADAGMVVLKTGQKVVGKIISENTREVILQTGSQAGGAVRQQVVVKADQIESMERDDPEKAPASVEGALKDLRVRLQDTDSFIAARDYKTAFEAYHWVSTHATTLMVAAEDNPSKSEAMQLRAQAYELWEVALEGQEEVLETQIKEKGDEIEDMVDRAEDEWDAFEDAMKENERERSSNQNIIRMGQRYSASSPLQLGQQLKQNLKRALAAQAQYAHIEADAKVELARIKSDLGVIEQRAKQASREVSELKRDSGRSSRR